MAKVLAPLPDRDFDVTEIAVPWKKLTAAGHQVVFATEKGGSAPACDPLLLTGVIFGQLGADAEPKAFYHEMEQSPEFRSPVAWNSVQATDFGGLLLTGGHAQGMRQYLESKTLQETVAAFWTLKRPVGAICHGTIVLARTIDPATGKSVLADMGTTCLRQYMEMAAYYMTAWKRGKYYRTYDQTVEQEVRSVLYNPAAQFIGGPFALTSKGTDKDDSNAFVCQDRHYVSARWPGDAYLYAKTFRRMLPKPFKPEAAEKTLKGKRQQS
ncbi:MAG TPA: type 1 glutamine amidotransferase domain-containing protein [Candidatus Xenobia bacterium]|jgi:putative intracellular protease/amidase